MHKCEFNGIEGCDGEGEFYPVLCLPPPKPGIESAAARSVLAVATCQQCRDKVDISNFMIPEAKEQITRGFMMSGAVVPDFDRAWLEWGDVGDQAWNNAQAALPKPSLH